MRCQITILIYPMASEAASNQPLKMDLKHGIANFARISPETRPQRSNNDPLFGGGCASASRKLKKCYQRSFKADLFT
jgi:hypothetical protein